MELHLVGSAPADCAARLFKKENKKVQLLVKFLLTHLCNDCSYSSCCLIISPYFIHTFEMSFLGVDILVNILHYRTFQKTDLCEEEK